ncbi:hypothetical protein ADK67_40955 [Saccharothrix sp. NRRL B-16348]|uniref:hypothetical protein n=1 Tax=Saccharothrix sp. NRRL B-16348 TaxID=1415542 RepID=UPI0006B03F28|nr:hypothetical protein [Saccharothrix sp. NRRL B-16348]KOX15901.1 hypothetical protein ADK67_40955 [Saccharothrix sp. NRRL B-16348]
MSQAPLSAPPIVAAFSSTAAPPSAAHLAAHPVAGQAGGEVRLSGEGFPAHGRVVFTFHGRPVGDTTADAVGRFAEVPVRVPESFGDAAPGTRFAIGATSGPVSAETRFVLTR